VADEHRALDGERVEQPDQIARQVVDVVGGDVSRSVAAAVAALVWHEDAEAGGHEGRHLEAPGVRELRKAVTEDDGGTAALVAHREADAVRRDEAVRESRHGRALLARARRARNCPWARVGRGTPPPRDPPAAATERTRGESAIPTRAMPLARVAVYDRMVRASLARVRENVLDWEHLPWLHRETFGHVRLLERRADGWRAESSLRDGRPGDVFLLDVAFEPDGLTYHSRTVAGRGAGTDIVTHLEPQGPGATRVAVELLAPDVSADRAERIDADFVRLYTRLWDQDEAMMIRRQALLDGRLVHGTRVVEVDGVRLRHGTVCPHLGGPLEDAPVADGCITCPWHGYRFDVRTGRNADGRGLRLEMPSD
jgi:hypothetical protein